MVPTRANAPAARRWGGAPTPLIEKDTKMAFNILVWVIQVVLALLFLFAGGMKLIVPIEALARPVAPAGLFMRFIGVCEVLGAFGLILPSALRIRPRLTPLAAALLIIIM